ncbi:hypothetical protein AMTRI_Chr06g176470 [Amborella trichopoda]
MICSNSPQSTTQLAQADWRHEGKLPSSQLIPKYVSIHFAQDLDHLSVLLYGKLATLFSSTNIGSTSGVWLVSGETPKVYYSFQAFIIPSKLYPNYLRLADVVFKQLFDGFETCQRG